MDSGKTRAASLMHAARRSHFVSRIEKYEAKLRQARAVPRDKRTGTTKQCHVSIKDDEVGMNEDVPEEKHVKEHQEEDSPEHKPMMEQGGVVIGTTLPQKLEKTSALGLSGISDTLSLGLKGISDEDEALALACYAPESNVHVEDRQPQFVQTNMYVQFLKPAANIEVNIAAIAASLKVRIKAADMASVMQEHAYRRTRDCLDTLEKLHCKRIAYTLKKEFDNVYGPAWHCIVGSSFGSYVTHSLGGFAYFSLDKVSVLLFKTTVEPLEHH